MALQGLLGCLGMCPHTAQEGGLERCSTPSVPTWHWQHLPIKVPPLQSHQHTQKIHSGIKHLMTLMAHSTVIRSRHVEIITGPEPRMTDFFPIQHMFYLDVCFFPPFLLLVSQTIIWFCGNREKHLKTEILNHTYLRKKNA